MGDIVRVSGSLQMQAHPAPEQFLGSSRCEVICMGGFPGSLKGLAPEEHEHIVAAAGGASSIKGKPCSELYPFILKSISIILSSGAILLIPSSILETQGFNVLYRLSNINKTTI